MLAQLKPELPSILHRPEGLKVRKESAAPFVFTKPGRKVKLFGTLSRTDDSSSSNNKLTRATRKT